MRIMALDIGKKRIGIALSDPLLITAQGLETYQRSKFEDDVAHYKDIISKYDVSTLVIGLPKTLKGEIGIAANTILEYSNALKEYIDIDIVMYDERLSSAHAHRIMNETNTNHRKRRKDIDRLAASLILSDYMQLIKNK